MTWLLWLGLMLCMLAVAAVGLTACADRRWAGAMRTLEGKLEARRSDRSQGGRQNGAMPPARYHARELEGLPAPVQRYFRAVLKDGQPLISAVTIDIAGTARACAGKRSMTTRPTPRWWMARSA